MMMLNESNLNKLVNCGIICTLVVGCGIATMIRKDNTIFSANKTASEVSVTSEVTESEDCFDIKDYVDMTIICESGRQCIIRDNLTNQLYYRRGIYHGRNAMTPIYNADGTVKELSEVEADATDIEKYFNYYPIGESDGRSDSKLIVCDKNTRVLYYVESGFDYYVLTVITDKDETGNFKVKLYEGEFDEET